MTRWSTLLMDQAKLSELPELSMGVVQDHAEAVLRDRLTPRSLYQRWEQQMWSAEDIDLERDREDWDEVLPERLRRRLGTVIATFIIGEYTAVELLSPIMSGAPEEDYLLYLGTQMADESRHAVFVSRIADEVLGMGTDLKRVLPRAWAALPPASRELNTLEAALSRDVSRDPADYGAWLRAVTMFHLVTEGMLAIDGQRTLVRALNRVSFLPGIKAGFTAMTRDESRHISFGMDALRTGIAEGRTDEIVWVLEKAVPLAVHIDAPAAGDSAPTDWGTAERTARRMRAMLRRRLEICGLDEKTVAHLEHLSALPPDSIADRIAPREAEVRG